MKKLIEVALPLEAINVASAREKSIRHGHPSTLHLWWARRPLAACRAVLFSSLVDDPGEYLKDEKQAHAERERLFDLITELVQWENSNDEEVLDRARLEIARSVARNLGVDVPVGKAAIREFLATKAPPVLDPFAGGGSIPLEAQRLGLRAYASDLNPVAVLINKALIEIPPRFANMPPVHPNAEGGRIKDEGGKKNSQTNQLRLEKQEWKGAAGLAEDVRYYGKWMRDEAEKRIGHLYPKVKLPKEYGDGEATVIAWLWARTVKCPNPSCGAMMPLVKSFELSRKNRKAIWIEPIVDLYNKSISYRVNSGNGSVPSSPKVGRGARFRCLVCGQPADERHVKAQGMAGKMGAQLMSIVAEGKSGRMYLAPDSGQEIITNTAIPEWAPEQELVQDKRALWTPLYGLDTFAKLFTARQLVALTTISDLLNQLKKVIETDARGAGLKDASATYTQSVIVYLSFALDKAADYWSSICSWHSGRDTIRNTFARQGIPMAWDFAEANPFSDSTGNWLNCVEWVAKAIESNRSDVPAKVMQLDASNELAKVREPVISTDPPYYDNIGYADLSDFFYVWLRRNLQNIYPELFSTLLTPKTPELVAAAHRFEGNRQLAEKHFLEGLGRTFDLVRGAANPLYPVTIYYAFKQSEEEEFEGDEGTTFLTSTGWETMLNGLLDADFVITGTWPMRTELSNRTVASGTNALASSIVLVCRPRPEDAPRTTRREFLGALKKELAPALRELQQGNIAPVDLAQAAIGPGMAIYSKYREVLEPDGTPMRVRTALALINQALDEYLTEQEGEYDADTRWALAWFEQYGHDAGPFGVAETLSKAKNTGIDGLVRSGILHSRGGQVHLLKRDELPKEWDPQKDARLTAWETVQYLVRALEDGGEQPAAALLKKLGAHADTARDLAYRLYTLCERKGWAQDALGYNMLVVAWQRLVELGAGETRQERLV